MPLEVKISDKDSLLCLIRELPEHVYAGKFSIGYLILVDPHLPVELDNIENEEDRDAFKLLELLKINYTIKVFPFKNRAYIYARAFCGFESTN